MRTKHAYRTAAALLGALLVAAPSISVHAQEPAQAAGQAAASDPEQESDFRVLRVRSEDTGQIAELLAGFDVMVRRSTQLGLLTIAGLRENVARAEEAVREIERLTMRTPASTALDVDLTVHLLGIVGEDAAPPPASLRAVVAELKKTLPFQGYKLLETIALRARAGDVSNVNGLLPEALDERTQPTTYQFSTKVAAIEPREQTQLIRFDSVHLQIRLPIMRGTSFQFQEVGISTALEVPDGKTVVVGKAGSVGESQGYLLVLTANVVK